MKKIALGVLLVMSFVGCRSVERLIEGRKEEVVLTGTARPDKPNTPLQQLLGNTGFSEWSNGSSFVNPSPGDYVADGWRIYDDYGLTAPEFTVSKTYLLNNPCVRIDYKKCVDCNSSKGIFIYFEVSDWAQYYGKVLSASARVMAKTPVTLYVESDHGTGQQSIGLGGWETIEVTHRLSNPPPKLQVRVGIQPSHLDNEATFFIDDVRLNVVGDYSPSM